MSKIKNVYGFVKATKLITLKKLIEAYKHCLVFKIQLTNLLF